MNFHPLIRVAANRALRHNIDANDALTAEQSDGLERIYGNEDGAFDSLVREIAARRHSMPAEGQAAMAGSPRPFVDWLTHGGFAWLYAIAQIVAGILGLKLPPLPAPPAPPAPPA